MTKQRNLTVDTAKALGITLVVIGHNHIVTRDLKSVHDWIYSFHMPLFMLLSGIFFSPAPLSYKSIQHKAESLLKPYFAASMVSAAITALRQPDLSAAMTAFGKVMFGSVVASPGTIEWVPLWFLPHLFVVQITATVIYSITRNAVAIAAVALAGTVFGQVFFADKGLPWGIDLTAVSCGFFILGHLVFPKVKQTLSHAHRCALLGMALGVAWAIAFMLLTPKVDLHLRIYSGLSAFIVAALGSAFTICSCAAIQQAGDLARLASSLGRYSLYILIFHGGIQGKVTGSLASRIDSSWIPACAGISSSIIACVLIGKLIERTAFLRVFFLPMDGKRTAKPPLLG